MRPPTPSSTTAPKFYTLPTGKRRCFTAFEFVDSTTYLSRIVNTLKPRDFDFEEALEARGRKNKKSRAERKAARKARKANKRRNRKAKKTPAVATEETSGAEGTAQPVNPEGGAGPVETRMVKRRLSARDFLLDEDLLELEAREEFFNGLNLD